MNLIKLLVVVGSLSVAVVSSIESFAQDTDGPPTTTSKHVAFLEPLIGSWEGTSTMDGKESPANITYRWINQNNFVLQTIKFGNGELEINHVIGWDPKNGAVKTWGFGGNGGHGELDWTQETATQWIEETRDWTVPTGEKAQVRLKTTLSGNQVEINGFFKAEEQARTNLKFQVTKKGER